MSTPTPNAPQGSTLSGSAAGLAGAPGASAPADPVTSRAAKLLADRLPGAVLESSLSGRHPSLRIAPAHLVEACLLLRDDPDLRMDCLHLLSGVDWPAPTPTAPAGEMEVVYHLVSYAKKPDAVTRRSPLKNDAFLVLKVRVPRSAPDVPSVMGVWPGADWHERETWDLLGIRFTGRPPLRRILLPEDWPGHPLRKDWEYPADYHGIPIIPPEGR